MNSHLSATSEPPLSVHAVVEPPGALSVIASMNSCAVLSPIACVAAEYGFVLGIVPVAQPAMPATFGMYASAIATLLTVAPVCHAQNPAPFGILLVNTK